MDINLSKVQGIAEHRTAWQATVHWITKSQIKLETEQQQLFASVGIPLIVSVFFKCFARPQKTDSRYTAVLAEVVQCRACGRRQECFPVVRAEGLQWALEATCKHDGSPRTHPGLSHIPRAPGCVSAGNRVPSERASCLSSPSPADLCPECLLFAELVSFGVLFKYRVVMSAFAENGTPSGAKIHSRTPCHQTDP